MLEDWVIDKTRGNGVTGWVGGCHGYQRQVIEGLEALVKYIPPDFHKADIVLDRIMMQGDELSAKFVVE